MPTVNGAYSQSVKVVLLSLLVSSLALAQAYGPPTQTLASVQLSGASGTSPLKLAQGAKVCLDNATCATTINADASIDGLDFMSNATSSGTNAAYVLDTNNAMGGSTLLLNLENHGTSKFTVDNTGVLTLGSSSSLTMSGLSDIGRIISGGSASGLIIYSSSGGTGTAGLFRLVDNTTDNNILLSVSMSASPVTHTLAGNYISSSTSGNQYSCSGAAACALSSASGQNATVDTGGGTATASLGATNATTVTIGTSTTTRPIQIAGGSGAFVGTCTMAAGTTCTKTVPAGAKCVCSPASAGTASCVGAALSSTTATITASASNSQVWNIICL